MPATTDAVNFQTMVQSCTDNATDSSVHAGGVAAAGKDTNSFYFHKDSSLFCLFKTIVSEERTNVKYFIDCIFAFFNTEKAARCYPCG